MRHDIAPIFKEDLSDIADWLAKDSRTRALVTIKKIRAELRRIARHPLLYQLRSDIADDLRLATYGPYIILFVIKHQRVRFERVTYAGRDLVALHGSRNI